MKRDFDKMKKIFTLIVLAVVVGRSGYASACEFCTLHNGLGQYNNQGDFISLTERYTTATTFVTGGGTVTTNPAPYAIYINTVQLMYQHAFSEDLKLAASLPYFSKRSTGAVEDSSGGPGDLNAMLRYTLWGDHEQFFAVMGGLKLPTGAKKTTEGVFNTDLVLGSGSIDPLLGFVYSHNIGGWSYSLDALYKISGKGYDGYQYGNVLNLGLGGYYRVQTNWNLGLGLASEIMAADNDADANGTGTAGTVANTGGTVVFASPTIQYTNMNNYLEVSYQLPVYRNFTGSQTVVDNKIILAYRHAF